MHALRLQLSYRGRNAMLEERDYWEAGGHYRSSGHPVVQLFARQRVAHLLRRGALDGVSTLLDVGAGTGFSSIYYPSWIRVVACDYALGMLRQNPAAQRVICLANRLPFAARQFDAVTCWELLHHLEDPVAVLREMWRVAAKRLIVFEPNRINPGHLVLAITRTSERRSARFSGRHLRRLARQATERTGRQERCGLLFPNVTPLSVARLLTRFPYKIPVVGISQLLILEKS